MGLEDHLHYGPGELVTNVQVVAQIARLVREMGYEPATPAEAREVLGLPRKGGPRPDFALG